MSDTLRFDVDTRTLLAAKAALEQVSAASKGTEAAATRLRGTQTQLTASARPVTAALTDAVGRALEAWLAQATPSQLATLATHHGAVTAALVTAVNTEVTDALATGRAADLPGVIARVLEQYAPLATGGGPVH